MEAKIPQEFFDKEVPARFKPEKVKGIETTAQLNLTGTNGGDWTVIIKDQKLSVIKGVDPSPTLTIKMCDEDFMDVVSKKMSAEKAFFTGKIQIKGNIAVALKLKDAGFL
jgi:putative sterol carrier protein